MNASKNEHPADMRWNESGKPITVCMVGANTESDGSSRKGEQSLASEKVAHGF